jgi:HEAT repeat protein
MRRLAVLVAVLLVAGGAWYYTRAVKEAPPTEAAAEQPPGWLDELYSQNPREVQVATEEVAALGPRALPTIQATLRDPDAEAERLKAALKACGIIGQASAPAIPEVTALLTEQGVTSEAAMALSYMGREALPPLRSALTHPDPIVRREALRSIGKLKERAPLELNVVLPVLVNAMSDSDAGVRAVGATYLGIIHGGDDQAIPALTKGLEDPDAEVRRASAAALAEFGPDAEPALPALRKASTDPNEDVAREAGRTIVKLQNR